MTEVSEIQCGMNLPEDVAYSLMIDIARTEKIALGGEAPNGSREWIIRTYCQCLQAVRNPSDPTAILATYAPLTG
jgi:hypothetical protein